MITRSPALRLTSCPDLILLPFTNIRPFPTLSFFATPSMEQWSCTMLIEGGRMSASVLPNVVGVFSRTHSMRPERNGSSSTLMRYGTFNVATSSISDASVMPRCLRCSFCRSYCSALAAAVGSDSCMSADFFSPICVSMRWRVLTASPAAPPPPPAASCALSCFTSSCIAASSARSFFSIGDDPAVAFLGESLITDALFANPRVEYVYGWNFTSGRIAQNKYVFAHIIVSLRYLHRKYELQPEIETPGLSFFALNASAIFMKNCAISDRERLIFFPWS
mmetsp:Transcript_80878/g.196075  ORF Transcript_80878/g.196075 Transcript_80878/m.196075 type:complete len:278 (+) Transcript_80878:982-1815(+)